MKWLAVAFGCFVLVAWLVLRQAPEAPGAPLASPTLPAPRAPVAAAPVAPAPASSLVITRPTGIALRGVLMQPSHPEDSRALLSVGTAGAQALRTGDMVDAQWRLDTIAADHVFVTKDGTRARLDVVNEARPVAAAPAGAASKADLVLPGFTPGAPMDNPQALANAHEANRRFIEARQRRAASAPR